jgi:hypothetical protein
MSGFGASSSRGSGVGGIRGHQGTVDATALAGAFFARSLDFPAVFG